MTSHKQQLLKVSSKQTGDGIIQGVGDVTGDIFYLLMESGDYLLKESGDKIQLNG